MHARDSGDNEAKRYISSAVAAQLYSLSSLSLRYCRRSRSPYSILFLTNSNNRVYMCTAAQHVGCYHSSAHCGDACPRSLQASIYNRSILRFSFSGTLLCFAFALITLVAKSSPFDPINPPFLLLHFPFFSFLMNVLDCCTQMCHDRGYLVLPENANITLDEWFV